MTDKNIAWRDLFFKAALAANCLPSSFIDGNEHVFKAIEAARATPADHISPEQCALALDPLYKQPEPGRSKVSTGYDEGHNDALDEAQQAIRALKSQQDAAIESMSAEPSVRDAALFDILMRRNIELTDEAYLSMRVVGVPPSEDEFVAALKKTIDAESQRSGNGESS